MFYTAPQALKKSLHTILDQSQEYLADVYFEYPTSTVWAHRALLTARVPYLFRTHHMQQLQESTHRSTLPSVLPEHLLRYLLRFWYTAGFDEPGQSRIADTDTENILRDIAAIEARLATPLLTVCENGNTNEQQWIADLARMRAEQLHSDVMINIFKLDEPKKEQQQTPDIKIVSKIVSKTEPVIAGSILNSAVPRPAVKVEQPSSVLFYAHRFMLASQSAYFRNLFCYQLKDVTPSTIHLPGEIFSPPILELILNYTYTETLLLPAPPVLDSTNLAHIRLSDKKHSLRLLQKVFRAADYLGHGETICIAILSYMADICHNFNCACSDCAVLLPSMLSFAGKYPGVVPSMRSALVALYSDFVSMSALWSQKPFSILIQSIVTDSARTSSANATLISDIVSATHDTITQNSAVNVLHTLHLCLSSIRSSDPTRTWSVPTLEILQEILNRTVLMISEHFNYYCGEYPLLLSCVDGINAGFSVDFLGFLLDRVLSDGITDENAATLYQGIVRDLLGRQEVVKNVAVDGVLLDSRQRCVEYIRHNLVRIKGHTSYKTLDKDILRQLSDDISKSGRIQKSAESDFSNLFGFNSKSAKAALKSRMLDPEDKLKPKPPTERARAHSIDNVLLTDHDREQLVVSQKEKPRRRFNAPTSQGSSASLTDALLAIENAGASSSSHSTEDAPRARKLKFELPVAPVRAKIVNQRRSVAQKKPHVTRRSLWGLGGTTSDAEEDGDEEVVPAIGNKVELLRRPLPTLGTIKYIGFVDFSNGIWVGVELESRVGNTDGAVDGKRYFQTDPQRGVFVKTDGFKIISSTSKS
ncbi:hypothetical protein BDF14DRAFT_1725574 [Spinellus fusiger]|nr:hypothetical protein BDF14DRAFT_1725574 [Spinellus fusiger]